jgi:tetratricopeptide (TPR) repeat protein
MSTVQAQPFGARGGNAVVSYCRYLGKTLWPTDLAYFYPRPDHWPLEKVLLAGAFLVGVSLFLFLHRRRYPFLLMGWLWFVGTLVPVLGLVQVGNQAMADRYTYLPSLGLLILTIWGACELAGRWRYQAMFLSVAGALALVSCVGLTRQQLGYWRDSETLFRHALAVTESNYLAHGSLGYLLVIKGQTDDAISEYKEVTRLLPDDPDAYNSLGAIFLKKDELDEAISQFQEAIRLKPDFAEARFNLGAAFFAKGRTDEAISQFREAIRLNPDDAETRYNLATVLLSKGQTDEAVNQFRDAIRLKPDYAEAWNNLGIVLLHKGQTDEAIRQFKEAIRLKPDHVGAYNNLGTAYAGKGQIDQAIIQFQEALRLNPDDVRSRENLARALATRIPSVSP